MTDAPGMGVSAGPSQLDDPMPGPGPARLHGLVAPLRLDAGMSVLLIGGVEDELVHTFASHGAEVLALEADTEASHIGGLLSVSLDSVRVVGSTLTAWLDETGSSHAFDLVIYRDGVGDGARTADLDTVLSVATSLLRPAGMLLVSADNPAGLSRLLGQPRTDEARAPSEVARLLREAGLPVQRWLVPYPDDQAPTSVVDATLLEEPTARDLIRCMVREPIRSRTDAHYPTAPLSAFHQAIDAGLAVAVCDRYVVLACRTAEALEDATRSGRLWLMPEAGTAPAWQRPRELIDIAERRLWHPLGNHGRQASGPLVLDPATLPAVLGHSGEDLIADALIGAPGEPASGRDMVATWAAAALEAYASAEPGRYPLDLRPRHFIVDADGSWRYQIQDLALRFPAPLSALLFGAMARTLADSILARGWLPGIDPKATLAEATRQILTAADIDTSDALVYIWVELASDVLVRTHDHVDRERALERVSARLEGTLAHHIERLPHDRLLAAGLDAPRLSADVTRLTAALEEARSAAHAAEQKPHEARPGSSNGDTGRTRGATADLIPAFASDEHYLAAVTQLEPWRPALDELLAREGITPHGSVRVATTSAYATFFVPPDHYAKIYLKRLAGHERHAVEIRTLRRLQNEPGLPVPTIVGEGRLGDRGRYLVMTRLPGKDVDSLRASLDEQSMERIVAWSGAFLRRLRDIPIEGQERDEAWDASIARLADLRGTAARGLRTRSGLPEHLIEQVEGWLPTGLELLGTKELLTLTHGAFGPGRVIIDIEAGVFEPTGVIDFNASSVTHPMSDFATAWAALRAESTTVVDAFMREAAFPAFGAREFPRRALAWAILQGVDAAYAAPDMDAIGSLDELAVTVFGRANSVAAETGTGAPDLDTDTQGHGLRGGGQADLDEDRARGPV